MMNPKEKALSMAMALRRMAIVLEKAVITEMQLPHQYEQVEALNQAVSLILTHPDLKEDINDIRP